VRSALLRREDRVPDVDDALFDDDGPQPASMDERRHGALLRQRAEVRARLAQADAFQEHLADMEPTAYEVIERHPAGDDVAAARSRKKLDSRFARQRIDYLGLDEGDVATAARMAGIRSGPEVIPIAFQTSSRDGAHLGHCFRELRRFGRKVNRFDFPLPHARTVARRPGPCSAGRFVLGLSGNSLTKVLDEDAR